MSKLNKELSSGLEQALRALDTLEEIDLTLAPMTATPEMISAAMRLTDLPAETVSKIYEIMIKISQE